MLNLPKYRPLQCGPWTLSKVPPQRFGKCWQSGYASGYAFEDRYFVLQRDGVTWMVCSRLEQESHEKHVGWASGTVVVCGVGMGMYLYNLALKPEVKRIIAIEIDPLILEILRDGTDFNRWPGREKIEFVESDAKTFHFSGPVDYLYVDIWPNLGQSDTIPDVQAMYRNIPAKRVGWWGQELDICSHSIDCGTKANLTLATFDSFVSATGLPILERTTEYLEFCWAVATRSALSSHKAFGAIISGLRAG